MKKLSALLLVLLFTGMTFSCTPYHSQGAGAGAVAGGISGMLLDHRNPWRGGVIGGVLGAIMGATLADVSVQAAREAAMTDRPVEYKTEEGRGVYRAEPLESDERTNCKKVRERVWEDGRLVKDTIKEICRGEKEERRY